MFSSELSYVRDEGYVYPDQQPGTTPLKLFWSPERADNFTTATAQGGQDALNAGYQFVRVEGYVSPRPTDIAIDLHSNLGANHYMDTHGSLLKTGHIDATTQTRTETDLGGFHGAVQMFLEDANGITIGGTQAHTFGVDGKWIGRSSRIDYWSEQLDPEIGEKLLDSAPMDSTVQVDQEQRRGREVGLPAPCGGPRGSPQDCPSSKPSSGRDDHGVRHEGSPTRARRHCPGRL